ncbi:alpha/beta fold hydrolase [Flavisphingopyxis soli]|nr:alpha/beta fold hydrolase [Sphingorhabdus soli]
MLLREVGVLADWIRGALHLKRGPRHKVGGGMHVMIVPGFMVADNRLRLLRMALNAAGFRAHRWKHGRNMGATADVIERIDARIDHLIAKSGGPIALVGWSLGGIYAREYAKRFPAKVSRVVTMGSPFSGNPRANNVWRIYELIARHPVDAPPIEMHPAAKPPVPTIALWSPRDGLISPESARGTPDERDREIELSCPHMGFICAPEAIEAIKRALVENVPLRDESPSP